MKNYNIALLGFGTVGRGVYQVIQQNQLFLQGRYQCNFVVKKILVRDPSKVNDGESKALLTCDFQEILDDESIALVVEVTGAKQAAIEYMRKAMQAGKSVTTANKYIMARHGEMLFKHASDCGVSLYFEASVGGGIPIIRELTEGLAANRIEYFYGILNGTTNYILTAMKKRAINYSEALADAQARGYAEADPSGDVKGDDAVNKLAILTMLAFDYAVLPEEIYTEGIEAINREDIQLSEQLGFVIKLLAMAIKQRDGIVLGVYPALIEHTHLLAAVDEAYNALFIKGNAVDEIMLYGKGAGGKATASAIVADIISIFLQADKRIDFNLARRYHPPAKVVSASAQTGYYYLRIKADYQEAFLQLLADKSIKLIDSACAKDVALIVEVADSQQLALLNSQLRGQEAVRSLLKVEQLNKVEETL